MASRYTALAICILPVAITMMGMSGYEWFNGKPSIWEGVPGISAQPAARNFAAATSLPTAISRVGSFDDLALSIRAKGQEEDRISECRFGGENLPKYRADTCFCTLMRMNSTGGL